MSMNRPGRPLPPALAWIPWWLSVIMAIVSYLGLKHLAPDLAAGSAMFKPMAPLLPKMAPLAAIGFLLLAGVLLYDKDEVDQPEEAPGDHENRQGEEESNGPGTADKQ
jgi:hypothetical protein